MPENKTLSTGTLALSAIGAFIPIVSGFIVIYSDIQVISAKVTANEQKFQVFETFVKERNPLTGRELRALLQEIKNEVRRNRDMRLCAYPATRPPAAPSK